MARGEYIEVECKSALNRVQGMPFKWSLNPYSGCAHRCQYCFARAHYALADRGDGGEDFGTRIFVKTNFPDVLRRELARPSWRFEQVALGTATDAYQPAEGHYRITRGALVALRDYANPVGMVTKSPLVLRDLDVLAELARVAKARVFFTITTMDQTLWRQLEPGTANPVKRLHVMRLLNQAGVPSGVLLAPIVPRITDSSESIEAVAAAAAEHGARFLGHSTLRLAPVVKEHFLGFVGAEFPDLLHRYERAYPGAYPPRTYTTALNARVERIRARYGFAEDSMRGYEREMKVEAPRAMPRRGRQLLLPLLH